MSLSPTFNQSTCPNHTYLASYKNWLDSQPMKSNTSRVYYSRVKQFLIFLNYANLSNTPLNSPLGMNQAMSMFLTFLKQSQKGNGTINAYVNALKNFSQSLGIEEAQLQRVQCYEKSAKILTLSEQENFVRAIERQKSARDKAIALILLHTGLRIGDCSRLNMDNVGAGAAFLFLAAGATVALNKQTAFALRQWLEERKSIANNQAEIGLWLTKQGHRLTLAGITCVIERIAWRAKLVVSAETLRRTCFAQAPDHYSNDELASKFGSYVGKSTIKRFGVSLFVDSIATP
jgi:integrase